MQCVPYASNEVKQNSYWTFGHNLNIIKIKEDLKKKSIIIFSKSSKYMSNLTFTLYHLPNTNINR